MTMYVKSCDLNTSTQPVNIKKKYTFFTRNKLSDFSLDVSKYFLNLAFHAS